MDLILVKIFATALALSEVLTQPQAVKTHFDQAQDQDEVVQILRNGCAHMRKAFDIESINVDDLIATALNDPKAVGSDIKAFHGINFADLNTAYTQFCKNESVAHPVVDLGQVIDFFNNAAADLPDQTRLKGRKLPSMSVVLDGKGKNFADVFEPGNRRVWVPLADVPDVVQKAFVAAEDRRFFQHHGVDERGIIRAFIGNLADPGRPQGGSTITQQVVKNLLVGEDVTYERKIREMIVASRLENTLSKQEILELYLNPPISAAAPGASRWPRAAISANRRKTSHCPKAPMLAGLLKGPSYFNPDRHPDRAKERLAYVLGRMQEDGVISAEQKDQALAAPPKLVAFERPQRDFGFHFVAFLGREAKSDGVANLTAEPYTIHSTINATLQRTTEAALQEGLARYEIAYGRMQYRGPEANLGDAIQKLAAASQPAGAAPAAIPPWQQALAAVHLPLYDVHWTPAVVVDKGGKRGDGVIRVGLADGRILPLNAFTAQIRRSLSLYDVIYVSVPENKAAAAKTKNGPPVSSGQAQLRVRPTVQGAALVIENKTGRILAMAGGFSYPLSQLNRAAQTQRQPGSAMKPLTYLTALQKGLQPNTLVPDEPITLPPIGSAQRRRATSSSANTAASRARKTFGRRATPITARAACSPCGGDWRIRSTSSPRICSTAASTRIPRRSLDDVCATAVAAKIYPDCIRYYPFVLGAQPVRMIDLAAFYAAVANEGARPQPHGIDFDRAERPDGLSISERRRCRSSALPTAPSFYQLKTMLQGVVARGTARAIGALSPYVAGKTGTTEDAVDGWFIGFTNDVTIAVWVGYDNGDGKRRSLGSTRPARAWRCRSSSRSSRQFGPNGIAPKAPLAGPSPEARRYLVDLPIDYMTGNRVNGGQGFIEHFRLGADGRFDETQYELVSRESADDARNQGEYGTSSEGYWAAPQADDSRFGGPSRILVPGQGSWPFAPPQPAPPQPQARGLFFPWGGAN